MLDLDLSALPGRLLVGTSSFSSPDWRGSFYPPTARSRDFLVHYATRLETVEIDSTFYASPPPSTVRAWRARTPEGFVIAAKFPKAITHEGELVGMEQELETFLDVMTRLGSRLGPLLLQFPYVARRTDPEEHASGSRFLERLNDFLELLPTTIRFAVEVRNAGWVGPPLIELLRSHRVALALTVYKTMPEPAAIAERLDPFTSEFAYLRFLGDHGAMDRSVAAARRDGRRVTEWGELLEDRTAEMSRVLPVIERALERKMQVFVYFNNHYAGFAPGSIASFARLYRSRSSRGGDSG